MTPAGNLFLVGPMGAGKTSIDRRLAERFGLAFIDLNQAIEAATGVRVANIFECDGEAGFREREERQPALELAGDDRLAATGSGAVLRDANCTLVRERGFVLPSPCRSRSICTGWPTTAAAPSRNGRTA